VITSPRTPISSASSPPGGRCPCPPDEARRIALPRAGCLLCAASWPRHWPWNAARHRRYPYRLVNTPGAGGAGSSAVRRGRQHVLSQMEVEEHAVVGCVSASAETRAKCTGYFSLSVRPEASQSPYRRRAAPFAGNRSRDSADTADRDNQQELFLAENQPGENVSVQDRQGLAVPAAEQLIPTTRSVGISSLRTNCRAAKLVRSS